MLRMLMLLGAMGLCAACGSGVADPVGSGDVNKSTQVVMADGQVEIRLDFSINRIQVINHNDRAIGIVIADDTDANLRLFSDALVRSGAESDSPADLVSRPARATIYVYKDSASGYLESVVAAFGADFEKHLDSSWIESTYVTTFTIH